MHTSLWKYIINVVIPPACNLHLPISPEHSTISTRRKLTTNLIKSNYSKPYRIVIKGTPPTTSPKTIQDELHVFCLWVQNIIPMAACRMKTRVSMQMIELSNVSQSHRISELSHLGYIKASLKPCKVRTVPPKCSVSIILSRCGVLSGSSGLRLLCRRTLFVALWEKIWTNFVPTCSLCKIGENC